MCLISVFLSIPVLLLYSPLRCVKVVDLRLFPVLHLCEPQHLFCAVWLAEREFKKLNLTEIIFQQFYLLVLSALGRCNHTTGELDLQVHWKSQIGFALSGCVVSYQELLYISSRLLSLMFKIIEACLYFYLNDTNPP